MVSLEDQIDCIKRELAFRRRCYPNWTQQGKIKPEIAERELTRMEAVLVTLEQVKAKPSSSAIRDDMASWEWIMRHYPNSGAYETAARAIAALQEALRDGDPRRPD